MSDSARQNRLLSLDAFRGMTIAAMILVNNPGTWSAIYAPLQHAEWHGITPTDYIFPFFLFIIGVAISISLGSRIEGGVSGAPYIKIFRRAISIFIVGLLISMIPFFVFTESTAPQFAKVVLMLGFSAALFFYLMGKKPLAAGVAGISVLSILMLYLAGSQFVLYNFAAMRIPGVLQRIAVCYLAASIIFLHSNWKWQVFIGIALLFTYWLLMISVPVPGCEITTIDDKACNLAAYIDRTILTEAHMWRSSKVFDPEGILSTIPAIVTTLSGVLTGTWLRTTRSEIEKAGGMFFFGTILLAVGWFWSLAFPLNKSLWTSSYVVYTSGLALLTLAVCHWLIDTKGFTRWSKPFIVFGVNALALFVFSGIMARMLGLIRVSGPAGTEVSLQKWVFDNVFLAVASPMNASLLYAVCFILLWWFLMYLLYRRRIYIKL